MSPASRDPVVAAARVLPVIVKAGVVRVMFPRCPSGVSVPSLTVAEIVAFVRSMAVLVTTVMEPPVPSPSARVLNSLAVSSTVLAAVPSPPSPWMVTAPASPVAAPVLLLVICAGARPSGVLTVRVPTFRLMLPAGPPPSVSACTLPPAMLRAGVVRVMSAGSIVRSLPPMTVAEIVVSVRSIELAASIATEPPAPAAASVVTRLLAL
jgi:hypothetical protein